MTTDPGPGQARRRFDPWALVLALVTLLYPFAALLAVKTIGPVPVVAVL